MFYLRQQRANIVQSVVNCASSNALSGCVSAVSSRQGVVLDLLSSLLDIVSPRVRPLPMVTLTSAEQQILLDACRVMEACGLSYVPTQQQQQPQSKFSRPYNNNTAKFGNRPSSGFRQNGVGLRFDKVGGDANNTVLQLEPAFTELLKYQLIDCELLGRHIVLPEEAKQVILVEQRKVSVLEHARRQLAHEEADRRQRALEARNSLFDRTPGDELRDSPMAAVDVSGVLASGRPEEPKQPDNSSTSHKIMQEQIERASSSGKRQRSSALDSFFSVRCWLFDFACSFVFRSPPRAVVWHPRKRTKRRVRQTMSQRKRKLLPSISSLTRDLAMRCGGQ